MIDVDRLTKLYDDHLAVDDVTFQLAAGHICGLVGPNGAGKTTTMRCLAGLIPATDGRLMVAGCDAQQDSIGVKQRLAYVPDDPPLFDDLTVAEHLDFIGRIYGIQDRRTKMARLLNEFDLIQKHDAGATTLSRGMRQKLAVCCAALSEPKVLLLDEPLTGLDPPGIRTLLDFIRNLAAGGTTIVISSHLLAMIQTVCTHLLLMKQGSALFFGRTQELHRKHPEASSLEEAYFAATTSGATGTAVALGLNAIPMDSSIAVGSHA